MCVQGRVIDDVAESMNNGAQGVEGFVFLGDKLNAVRWKCGDSEGTSRLEEA